ncbi:hypothetical protein HPB51_028708 [Rhipicephalus microplus]|uniref:CUB domain-containing protein n=1 Tax=Rhipicephalus microplus TaxID=6941 RepID=A0A9J6CWJ7_RHIMP|nr:hypothetical protein HPB51_028708 [Rhipicephalus microplus]
MLLSDFPLWLFAPSASICKCVLLPWRRCENVDSVIGFITIKGQRERLDNFCGSQLPNQIMSNEHRMTVIFQSFGSRPPSVKGFRAIYQFVTNFGIPSGRQDPQGVLALLLRKTFGSSQKLFAPIVNE